MYKIGYVDEDEGQRSSFYHYLKYDFEVVLFEITQETKVELLVDEIFNSRLDILVLDFLLDETGLVDFNADQLVDPIQERNLYYPLVVLTSHEPDAFDNLANANLVNGKEEMLGSKVEIFKQKLNKIASTYQNKISETEAELTKLEQKRTKEGLEPDEESIYVDLNHFLDNTVAAKGHISRTFYSEDTNKKLDELINKTEEMLNKIPDKK